MEQELAALRVRGDGKKRHGASSGRSNSALAGIIAAYDGELHPRRSEFKQDVTGCARFLRAQGRLLEAVEVYRYCLTGEVQLLKIFSKIESATLARELALVLLYELDPCDYVPPEELYVEVKTQPQNADEEAQLLLVMRASASIEAPEKASDWWTHMCVAFCSTFDQHNLVHTLLAQGCLGSLVSPMSSKAVEDDDDGSGELSKGEAYSVGLAFLSCSPHLNRVEEGLRLLQYARSLHDRGADAKEGEGDGEDAETMGTENAEPGGCRFLNPDYATISLLIARALSRPPVIRSHDEWYYNLIKSQQISRSLITAPASRLPGQLSRWESLMTSRTFNVLGVALARLAIDHQCTCIKLTDNERRSQLSHPSVASNPTLSEAICFLTASAELDPSDPVGNYNLALALAHATQLMYTKEDALILADEGEDKEAGSRKLSDLEVSLASQAQSVVSGPGKEFLLGWVLLALVQSFLEESPGAAYAACDAGIRVASHGQYETVMLHLIRAALALREGSPAKAVKPCEQALANLLVLADKDTRRMAGHLWLELLRLFLQLSWYERAHECAKHISRSGGPGVSLYVQGLILESKGESADALRAYQGSSLKGFRNWRSMVSMAGCLLSTSPTSEEARLYLKDALRLEPTCYEAWYRLGLFHKARGELIEARRCLTIALTLERVQPVLPFRLVLYAD